MTRGEGSNQELHTPVFTARIAKALGFALQSGPDIPAGNPDESSERVRSINQALGVSSEHRAWVTDQMVRSLAGEQYGEIVRNACYGEDGPDTYEWNTGAQSYGRGTEASFEPEPAALDQLKGKVDKAIGIAVRYGQIDGDHHRAWAIDRMVQALAGDRYGAFVRSSPSWYAGIAPGDLITAKSCLTSLPLEICRISNVIRPYLEAIQA